MSYKISEGKMHYNGIELDNVCQDCRIKTKDCFRNCDILARAMKQAGINPEACHMGKTVTMEQLREGTF